MDTELDSTRSVLREAHLRDYWKVVWQGRWTVLAIFCVVLGATAAWTYIQTPIYRATATVEIQSQARRLTAGRDVSGLGATGYGWFAVEKYHNTQVEIIKSRDVARRVMSDLGLEAHPMFAEAADPIDAFRRLIQVEPRRETGLLEISISGQDRDLIQEWVNAVAWAYEKRNIDKAKANVDRAVNTIKGQVAELRGELLSAVDSQPKGASAVGEIFDAESQQGIVRLKLERFHTELTGIHIDLSRLEDTLRQADQMRRSGADPMALPELAADPMLQELQKSKVEIERQVESAKVELRPGNPKYKRAVGELAKVQQRMDDKIALVLTSMRNRYELLANQKSFLTRQIELAERYSTEVAEATSKQEIVKTDSESKKQIFDLINQTLEEAQLSAQLMENNVSVLDEAIRPLYPIKPRKKANLAIGALFGMFLGVGAVFFLDYLDNTIRTPEDVEKFLGLSVLGVVPKMAATGVGARAIREAYQSLRTSVIFSSKNRERKLILVTSTSPREGKSSTAAHLGRTLAAAGDRVVIIDCDLRRPTQHDHHGLKRDPGLTNYLAAAVDETDWSPFAKPADPPSLHVMPCGPIPPSPPELLGNTRFAQMLAEMRKRYDWVIMDSPPAASLADASLLASLADMIVVVVKHNATDRDVVVKTVNQIRAVNGSIAGVVLNNVDIERAYHKDYYYAGYYYHSEDEETGKSGKGRKGGVERKAQVG